MGKSKYSDSEPKKFRDRSRGGPKGNMKNATPTGPQINRGQYPDDEFEVLKAVNDKRVQLRRILTVTEIFQVIKDLGYKREQ